MTNVFPLSLAALADKLGIVKVNWSLGDQRELSGMASGQFLEADLAPQLWDGVVTLRPRYHAESRRIEAILDAVIRSKGDFYMYDVRHKYPASDPGGSILGAAAVKISAVADAKSMSLKGLPASYVLGAGDYLHFDYGAPARRWFGELSEDATASGAGVTGTFEVSPFLPSAAAADMAVTLIKPAMKCRIVPGSRQVSSLDGDSANMSQISFTVKQKR